MADNSERISEIEEILRSGVQSHSNDGTSVTHDFAALRSELRKLRASDDTEKGRRPGVVRINLGSF